MTNDKVKYQIKGIEILDIQLNYPEKPLEKMEKYGFEMTIENKINFSNKMIFVVPKIIVLNEIDKTILGSISVSCAYHVENFDDFADEKNKAVNFPKIFELAINTVSISTVRGIMYAQFRGTFLQNAILPVIDPGVMTRKE